MGAFSHFLIAPAPDRRNSFRITGKAPHIAAELFFFCRSGKFDYWPLGPTQDLKKERKGPGKPGRPTPLLASGRARRAGGAKKRKKKKGKRGRKAGRQRDGDEKERLLISFVGDRKKQVADRLKRSKTDGLSTCEVRKRLFDTPNF